MSTVRIEDERGVRTLTLNRPERKNALTPAMQEELIAALRGVDEAKAHVVVLKGEAHAFCAGLDLSALQKMSGLTAEQHRIEAERVNRMFRALHDCDVPTIAMVEGPAIAGGTGLAFLCDFTLAEPAAKFGYTEVRIGFVPALVNAYLTLQVGDKVARGLLLSARIFGAEEALQLGLVNEIVAADALHSRTYALAAELMRNSPAGMRATKQLLRAQHKAWLDNALSLAMEANAASRQTPDFAEGVAAFLEKRQPVWRQ